MINESIDQIYSSDDIRSVFHKDPKKREELSAFYWFSKAMDLKIDSLECSESPDFIAYIGSKKIGVELTLAERLSSHQFSIRQIEVAQNKFAKDLLGSINPKIPLEIFFSFDITVPVDSKGLSEKIKMLADFINDVSQAMSPHSSELVVRKEKYLELGGKKNVFPSLPNFVQHIQLINDGHKSSVVSGCRGGVVDFFEENNLCHIIDKKHQALLKYEQCDEH